MNRFLLILLFALGLGSLGPGLTVSGQTSANPPDNPPAPETPESGNDGASKAVKLRIKVDSGSQEIVQTGMPVHVKTNEVVPMVVVVQSSATIDGEVEHDVVVVGGEAIVNGHVGGNVVNVGSGIVLGPGATVDGNAVGVLGGVEMGADSEIKGDAVGVVGGVRKAAGARVGGKVSNIAIGDWIGPDGHSLPKWLKTTFTEILLKLRPLSFRVGWVWVVAGLFLGLYMLLVLAAPETVRAVANTLSERGATSFLMGLLSLPLVALVSFILLLTGIGVLALPFVWAAVFFTGLVGKAGLLQFLGSLLGKGSKRPLSSVGALVVGAVLLSLLYLIPFLGLLFWLSFSLWALGAGMLALMSSFRRESTAAAVAPGVPNAGRVVTAPMPSYPVVPPPPSTPPAVPPTSSGLAPGSMALNAVVPDVSGSSTPSSPPVSPESSIPASTPIPLPQTMVPVPPPPPAALTYPRVGLKERIFAMVIDWFLLAMFVNWFDIEKLKWLLFLGYFGGLWVWRGTTVGGIVLRLQVVRLDGRPIDVGTALVRAIAALFSGLALGIGYFWIAWDPEKQGWHDKIAGTVVVRTPKSQPLV